MPELDSSSLVAIALAALGRVELVSARGKASTVTLSIPRAPQ